MSWLVFIWAKDGDYRVEGVFHCTTEKSDRVDKPIPASPIGIPSQAKPGSAGGGVVWNGSRSPQQLTFCYHCLVVDKDERDGVCASSPC